MEEDGREEEKEPLAEPEHFVNSSLESESNDPEVDALAQQVAAKGSSGDENRIARHPGHIQCHVTYRSAYLYHLYHPPGQPATSSRGHILCHVTYRSAYLYHLYHPPGRRQRSHADSRALCEIGRRCTMPGGPACGRVRPPRRRAARRAADAAAACWIVT